MRKKGQAAHNFKLLIAIFVIIALFVFGIHSGRLRFVTGSLRTDMASRIHLTTQDRFVSDIGKYAKRCQEQGADDICSVVICQDNLCFASCAQLKEGLDRMLGLGRYECDSFENSNKAVIGMSGERVIIR